MRHRRRVRKMCAVPTPPDALPARAPRVLDLYYPYAWGTLRHASPVAVASAWAERLRGRAAANAVRRLLADVERDPVGCGRGRDLSGAGLRLRGLSQEGAAWRAEAQVDLYGRTVAAEAISAPAGSETAGQVAATATARVWLAGLARLGVRAVEHEAAQEVVLCEEVLRALSRPPIAGATLRAVESWRLRPDPSGAVAHSSAEPRLAGLRVHQGATSLALVHWAAPRPPTRGAEGALRAWALAVRRAAALAGLTDAHEWAFCGALGRAQ